MKPKRIVLKYYASANSVFEAENVTTEDGQPLITWGAPKDAKVLKEANVDKEVAKANRNISGDFKDGQIRCTVTRPRRKAIHDQLEGRRRRRIQLEKERIEEEGAERRRQNEAAKNKAAENARKQTSKGKAKSRTKKGK